MKRNEKRSKLSKREVHKRCNIFNNQVKWKNKIRKKEATTTDGTPSFQKYWFIWVHSYVSVRFPILSLFYMLFFSRYIWESWARAMVRSQLTQLFHFSRRVGG